MNSDNLKYPLLFTRLSIAVFLLPWILMRFTKVEGAQNIAAKYYKISNLPEIAAQGMGVIWLVLLLASGFIVGAWLREGQR